MTIDDLEIARKLGASAFLVYQTLKLCPKSSQIDLQIETGLSQNTIQQLIKTMSGVGLIYKEKTKSKRTSLWAVKTIH